MRNKLIRIAVSLIVAIVVWEISGWLIDMQSNVAFFGGWLFRITVLVTIAHTIYKAVKKIVKKEMKRNETK